MEVASPCSSCHLASVFLVVEFFFPPLLILQKGSQRSRLWRNVLCSINCEVRVLAHVNFHFIINWYYVTVGCLPLQLVCCINWDFACIGM